MVNFRLRPLLALIVFCIVQLARMLKRKPDIKQACLMPVSTVEVSDVGCFQQRSRYFHQSSCMVLTKLSGVP